MPDTKITALTAIGANPIIPSTFPIPMVDLTDTSMAASGTTKKVTVNQILGAGGTATLASATITGDLTVDTSTLKVDSANNRVGVLTATPGYPLHVNGTDATNVLFNGATKGVRFVASASKYSITGVDNTGAATFQPLAIGGASLEFQIGSTTHFAIDASGIATWSNVGGVAGTAMTLNSTGLGVGASPSFKLEVVAPAGDNIVSLFRSGDATAANNAGGGFRSISSATAASRVAQIWLDADGANLSGGDYFIIQKNGNSGTVEFNQSSNAAMTFLTNGTERMRIDSSGNVGVGVTPSGSYKVEVSGKIGSTNAIEITGNNSVSAATGNGQAAHGSSTTLGNVLLGQGSSYDITFLNKSGSVAGYVATGATTITTSSDERIKENLVPITNAISKVSLLRSVIGNFVKDFDPTLARQPFLIAQDVDKVLPEAVVKANPDQWGVNYTQVIPLLVAAIQELTARVEALEA